MYEEDVSLSFHDHLGKRSVRIAMNLNEFMKKRHVETILNDEAICKRLYPLVPPCLRSPAGLKRIVVLSRALDPR